MKYLDLTGLSEVWANIKSYISSKIPIKTSQLQNDSNYVTTSQLPSKTSQLINDSDFTTNAKLISKANDSDVVHKSGDETVNGTKTFNNTIQTNGCLYTKDNICLRIQNIDNNETNPTQDIGSCGIGFTNKDATAWWAYNRYFRTTVDGTAFLQLYCLPIKKSDGSSTIGGYLNIYNTGVARVNDPLSIDPNATWNNNNIVTSNWVRKYFSNSIGDYWSKSATGNQYSRSTFSYLSTIDKTTTNTSWSIYRPFRIVDKDNSIELGHVEYGYKSDLAYTRLFSNHNTGGSSNLTIHNNGTSYFENCRELWLVNKNLGSYNTTPSNEIDTQIWFTDKNANKYATLQTDYFTNGIRQLALMHKSLRTNTWTGLSIKTSPTEDVITCQPRFCAQDNLIVQNTDSNKFTEILQGWIEMSSPDYCGIDFKHKASQDYLGRIALHPNNTLYLETINGAPICANGKNIVRSVNGVNADNNGNVSIQNPSLPIGSYIQFAGSQAPSGFLVCNGGAVSRTTYANLFDVIGTTYGSGDGSTTFNLPNLTDRFLQGSTRIGTVKYAGLPNIRGTISIGTVDNAPESYSNGALSMVSASDQGYQRARSVRTLQSISFDASNYNLAYGNSSTIQPPALTCLICIKY